MSLLTKSAVMKILKKLEKRFSDITVSENYEEKYEYIGNLKMEILTTNKNKVISLTLENLEGMIEKYEDRLDYYIEEEKKRPHYLLLDKPVKELFSDKREFAKFFVHQFYSTEEALLKKYRPTKKKADETLAGKISLSYYSQTCIEFHLFFNKHSELSLDLIISQDTFKPKTPKNKKTRILWLFDNESNYNFNKENLSHLGKMAFLKS